MKKLILSFAVAGCTLLLFFSCKKRVESLSNESNVAVTEPQNARLQAMRSGEAGDAETYFANYGTQYETFMIDPRLTRTIRLRQGTRITIPAGAFMLNGQVIRNGSVRFDVLELPDRGAMARRGFNTMAGATLLESDGSFDMIATLNGVNVDRQLAPGRSFRFVVPDWQPTDRTTSGLFAGAVVQGNIGQAQFNWQSIAVPGQSDVIPNTNGTWPFDFVNVGGCNIDVPATPPQANPRLTGNTTLTVNLTNNPGVIAGYQGSGGANTYVLLAPKGINALAQLYLSNGNNQVSSLPNSVAVGMNARLLAYSVVNGNYYLAKKDIITTAGMTESLTFAPSDAATLTTELNALNSY
jgi:hypothetical protein